MRFPRVPAAGRKGSRRACRHATRQNGETAAGFGLCRRQTGQFVTVAERQMRNPVDLQDDGLGLNPGHARSVGCRSHTNVSDRALGQADGLPGL